MINKIFSFKLDHIKHPIAIQASLILLALALIGLYLPGKLSSFLVIPALFVTWGYRSVIQIDRQIRIAFYLLLAYLIFFTLFSQSVSHSADGVYNVLRGCLFFPFALVFAELARRKGLLFVNLLAFIVILGNFLFLHDPENHFFFSYYKNPNNAAVHLVGLCILVLPLVRNKKWSCLSLNSIISIVGVAIGLYLLILTNSRGAWLGVCCAVMIWGSIRRDIQTWIRLTVCGAMLLGLFALLYYLNYKGFQLSLRGGVWIALLKATVQEHLFLGFGIGCVKPLAFLKGLVLFTAHNVILEVFVCSGILGLIWVFTICFVLKRHLMRFIYHKNTLWSMGILGLSAFLIMGQFDLQFFAFRFMGSLSFFIGLIYSQRRQVFLQQ
ncbi:MAG: O-antigen ligase family protein [Desulfobacterales bacterium]|nr:O-antigen ligase family protein [Desulfobacterales bacterium]